MSKRAIFVTAPSWCASCRNMHPVIRQAAQQTGWDLDIINLDDDPAAAACLEVSSLPTTIMMVGSEETGRIVGAYPLAKTIELLGGTNG